MTNRVQTLRSSTTGNVPAAGTRQPGELWANFVDLQFGVIDTTKTAQKLVAVRYFSTSANYAAGDFVVQAGLIYAANGAITAGAFNSTQWTALYPASNPLNFQTAAQVTASLAGYLPLVGGTMSGPVTNLTLAADPTSATQAATKHYVDSATSGGVVVNPNRLINGDMYVDQRNAGGSSVAVNTYTVDRWYCAGSQSGKLGWRQAFIAATKTVGFNASLLMSGPSTPYAPLAGDLFFFGQPIEADMVTDFLWGSAGALPVTLSFWFSGAVAGTYSGAIFNYAGTRSYPFTFTIAGPAIQQCIVTIPGDTGGTWTMGGSGGSMWVVFDFGCGSTYRGPSGATAGWTSSNLRGVTGTAQPVNTASANIFLTGVKLELGNVATPYPQQSLSRRLADCQRYYSKTYQMAYAPGTVALEPTSLFAYTGPTGGATSLISVTWSYPVTMRVIPTVTEYSAHTGAVNKCWATGAGADYAAIVQHHSDCTASLSLNNPTVLANDTLHFHAAADAEI